MHIMRFTNYNRDGVHKFAHARQIDVRQILNRKLKIFYNYTHIAYTTARVPNVNNNYIK